MGMQVNHALSNVPWNCEPASKPQSDIAILLLIAQGDRRAMHVLFVRYKVRVYRYALRLTHDEAVAQDLVNEVFLEVWRNAAKFEGRSQVRTWLLAITRNLAATILRRRPTERLEQRVAESIADPADDPGVAMEKVQQNLILATCLNELSPPHRQIIDLVYYHEKSISEVAEMIGIPRNTVKTRMFYARNEIAELLKRFRVDWARPRDESPSGRQTRKLHGCHVLHNDT